MGDMFLSFAVRLILSIIFMWLTLKTGYVILDLREIVIIIITTNLSELLPNVGFTLSLVLFIFLVMRFSGCSAFDAATAAILTKVFVFASLMLAQVLLS